MQRVRKTSNNTSVGAYAADKRVSSRAVGVEIRKFSPFNYEFALRQRYLCEQIRREKRSVNIELQNKKNK